MEMLVIFVIVFGIFYAASCDEEVVVKTQYGWVKGLKQQTVIDDITFYSFQGIPYAQPPLGKLRFLAPIPPKKWRNIRDATVLREECVYIEVFSKKLRGSEDCLYLNVYTPNLNIESDDDTDARTDKSRTSLPVIVYFAIGIYKCFDMTGYPTPDFLVSKNVVVVIFEFRQLVLGFLNLGIKEVPGNAGIKDQVAVLKWIKHNIEEFGGNPNSVTLLGAGDGTEYVILHTFLPMSAGLFHKVIATSGQYRMFEYCYKHTFEEIKNTSFNIGKTLGYDTENASLLLELLQDVPCITLLSEADFYDIATIIKSQDIFLNRSPEEHLNVGNLHLPDIMFTYSNAEALMVLKVIQTLHLHLGEDFDVEKEMVQRFQKNDRLMSLHCFNESGFVSPDLLQKIRNYYVGRKATIKKFKRMMEHFTHTAYFIPAIRLAKKWSKFANTYFMKFSSYSSRNLYGSFGEDYGCVGAGTFDILSYIFYTESLPVTEGILQYKMANQLTNTLTYFVKYGEPSPDCVMGVEWPTFDKKVQAYAEFTDEINIYSFLDDDDVEFWQEIYESLNLEF